MIVGLGLDIIEIERIRSALDRWGDRIVHKVFTGPEIERWQAVGSGPSRLAGRFAAKEAAMKALGVGWGPSAGWRDFEIINDNSGRPLLSMTGSAADTAGRLGVQRTHLSISHSERSACAVVVLES